MAALLERMAWFIMKGTEGTEVEEMAKRFTQKYFTTRTIVILDVAMRTIYMSVTKDRVKVVVPIRGMARRRTDTMI